MNLGSFFVISIMQHSTKFLGHSWWIFRIVCFVKPGNNFIKEGLSLFTFNKGMQNGIKFITIETFTALTSSILTSPKREIDRDNPLSEPTTYWNYFVPILVHGLRWVPEAFGFGLSLFWPARKASGTERFRWFLGGYRWLQVVLGACRWF